jgi:hypothetical protein
MIYTIYDVIVPLDVPGVVWEDFEHLRISYRT